MTLFGAGSPGAGACHYPSSPFPDPVGQSPGVWTGVFRDEFTGAKVVTDATNGYVNFGGPRWSAWYPPFASFMSQSPGQNHTNNPGRELEWYDYSALSTSSSVLSMTATYDQVHSGLPYTSGMIISYPDFSFLHGYVEARIKCPQIAGEWPAFWMQAATDVWPPEIDMYEQFGNDPPTYTSCWQNSGPPSTHVDRFVPTSDTLNWHVFGMKWTAASLTFYLDGTQYVQDTTAGDIPTIAMNVVLNMAVDGNQTFTAGVGYPASFQADYIRVWQ